MVFRSVLEKLLACAVTRQEKPIRMTMRSQSLVQNERRITLRRRT